MRVHNSPNFLDKILSFKQENKPNSKPKGFWYAIDNEWIKWCKSEMPHWIKKYNFEVILPENFNLLKIDNLFDLHLFSRKYRIIDQFGTIFIDWKKVAETYDGIEIAPYQYEARHDKSTLWYYGWDVASGCIWNGKDVKINNLKALDKSLFGR